MKWCCCSLDALLTSKWACNAVQVCAMILYLHATVISLISKGTWVGLFLITTLIWVLCISVVALIISTMWKEYRYSGRNGGDAMWLCFEGRFKLRILWLHGTFTAQSSWSFNLVMTCTETKIGLLKKKKKCTCQILSEMISCGFSWIKLHFKTYYARVKNSEQTSTWNKLLSLIIYCI